MRSNNVAAGMCRSGLTAVFALLLSTASAFAEQPAMHDLTPRFLSAGVKLEGLRAIEVGGIVVLRGRTTSRAAAEHAAAVAQTLGYKRVANLIEVAEVPDDARITRDAERELSTYRSLDGVQIAVASSNGVVRLRGKFLNEMQKDMAVSLVRNIDGVRSVQVALYR